MLVCVDEKSVIPLTGESIPIRLFLSPYELTPTHRNINNKFSVKYYLNLVLVDEEDRRYFKQQEITIYRLEEDSWFFFVWNCRSIKNGEIGCNHEALHGASTRRIMSNDVSRRLLGHVRMLFIGECYVEFVLILYLFLLVIPLLGLLYRWASMYLEFEARIPVWCFE